MKNLQRKAVANVLHNSSKDFIRRHIGPSEKMSIEMLTQLGYKSLR